MVVEYNLIVNFNEQQKGYIQDKPTLRDVINNKKIILRMILISHL